MDETKLATTIADKVVSETTFWIALIGVIGAIIGSGIALLGVLFTLRSNHKIHEETLKEEREKNRREREYIAKQKAFLSAAEAIVRFISYYVSLPNRVLPADDLGYEVVTEMEIALNRLHFYCDLKTIEKTTYLSQVLYEFYSEAMEAKMPSLFIGEELKAIDIEITGFEQMNAGIQEEINALLTSDSTNPLLITHRENLSKNFTSIADLYGKKSELIKKQYIEIEKCRDVIHGSLKEIHDSSKDVMLLARKELNFPIAEEQYKKLMDDRTKSMLARLDRLATEVRKQVTEKMQ